MQKLIKRFINNEYNKKSILFFTKNNNYYIIKQIVFRLPSKHFHLQAYTYQLINNSKTLDYADLLNNKELDISLKQNDKVHYSKADYTLYINGNNDFKHEYKQVNQSFDRVIMNDVYTIFNDIELTDYSTEKTILNDVGNLITKLVDIIENTYKNTYDNSFGNTFYKNDKEIYSTIYYMFLQNSDLSIEKKIELIKQLFGISE